MAAVQPLPEGAVLRDGSVFMRSASPPFPALAAVNALRKKGTAGAQLPENLDIKQGGMRASVPTAPLWEAICASGGLHLVRARHGLLEVVLAIPGQGCFPAGLAAALDTRIKSRLEPMYGYTKEEELSTLMQHRNIQLPRFDVVGPKGGPSVPAELLWAKTWAYGGPAQVCKTGIVCTGSA